MGVVDKRVQRFWSGARGGGRKSVHNVGVDRDDGLTLFFLCGLFDALFLHEKVWTGHDTSMLLD